MHIRFNLDIIGGKINLVSYNELIIQIKWSLLYFS
jgi:hypothetical protein